MTTKFDALINRLVKEADQPDLGGQGGDAPAPEAGGTPEGGQPTEDDLSLLQEPTEPTPPEELELARLAVRALNFNIHSKDTHQYSMKVNGVSVPFEKMSDYFEQTKNWKPVLQFIEWVMNKFEGISSKWSEQEEIKGKDIIEKIKNFNKKYQGQEDMLLDNSKRLVWTRIILNSMLHADPSFNLVGTDVNEKNIKEIFNLLKQHFNHNSRGLFNQELPGPGTH